MEFLESQFGLCQSKAGTGNTSPPPLSVRFKEVVVQESGQSTKKTHGILWKCAGKRESGSAKEL